MMKFKRGLVSATVLSGLVALAGCGVDYDDMAARRQRHASRDLNDILVVAIDEPWVKTYINGIRLAERQLNEAPPPDGQSPQPARRNIKVLVKSGGLDLDATHGTLLNIAGNPNVAAVLGHSMPDVAIPASVVYEASRIVFMPPFTAAQGLTSHAFKFVFRLVPDTSVMTDQIASVAALLGHKRIVLLYTQDDSSRESAFLFEDAAIERGMDFVHRRSFYADDVDYRELITRFSSKPFDMVFLSSGPNSGARMVRQLREMGVKVPIFGSDALNGNGAFAEGVGNAGDNVIVPVVYNGDATTQRNEKFRRDYRAQFDEWPDQAAAQGYDSLRLLAAAIHQSGSAIPSMIASTLHFMPYWTGVTGVHSFDSRGDVIGKKYFFRVFRDREWHFLPAVHMPYFLDRFDQALKAQSTRPETRRPFLEQFSKNLHPDDLRIVQLDFLHEILRFENLGVIYGQGKPGEIPEKVARMTDLGKRRGFAVTGCGVAVSEVEAQVLQQRLQDCYGTLSIAVDALNLVELPDLGQAAVARLQKPLKYYKIPVLALTGDNNVDEGTAIRVGRLADKQNLLGNKQNAQADETLISGVLHSTRMYELKEKLNNLPVLEVNLEVLNDYGLLHSGTLVGLAPDLHLEWLVTRQ